MTLVLAVLLAAYAMVMVRVPAPSASGQRFDAFAPHARTVELLVETGRFEQALPLAAQLRVTYPHAALVVYWTAKIYHGLERTQDEVDAWESYLTMSPAPTEACPSLPEAYARLGQSQQALSAYERCASFDPRDRDRLFDLGQAYERAGRPNDAVDAYRRLTALDPANPFVQARIARLRP